MKVQLKLFITFIVALSALTACQKQQAESEAPAEAPKATSKSVATTSADDPDVIATVNGKPITNSDFEDYYQQKAAATPNNVGDPTMVLNEMINKELLLQAAVTADIENRPEISRQITDSKNNILINTLINEKVSKIDNSDEALKAEYDAQVSSISLKEYKARHILVNDEETAKGLISELNEGKDFETLAKEKSTGPSGPNGGDLGWFQPQTMVPEFATALQAMEKGTISKEPVKTQFGWHIIKYEDIRDLEAPPFEESKAQLQSILANKTIQNYMSELRSKATIDIKQAEQPAEAAPTAPAMTEPATGDAAATPAPADAPGTTQ